MARQEFSVKVRKAAWARCQGKCEADFCGMAFGGESPEYHHVKEDFYDGEPTLENCLVVHYRCHKLLTKAAATGMAKVRRIETKSAGIKPTGRPMPGSRNSAWKQTMNHGWQRRE